MSYELTSDNFIAVKLDWEARTAVPAWELPWPLNRVTSPSRLH
jgi:hypothetical protein